MDVAMHLYICLCVCKFMFMIWCLYETPIYFNYIYCDIGYALQEVS